MDIGVYDGDEMMDRGELGMEDDAFDAELVGKEAWRRVQLGRCLVKRFWDGTAAAAAAAPVVEVGDPMGERRTGEGGS